jgi:hypothetical protein
MSEEPQVSGRYLGEEIDLSDPGPGSARWLDLRIDIDSHSPFSPTLSIVSGDVFSANTNNSFAGLEHYQYTWKFAAPPARVFWERAFRRVTITKDPTSGQPVQIVLTWDSNQPPTFTAEVTFAGPSSRYVCTRRSHWFRTVGLEVDFCSSVGALPLPNFRRDARLLTIAEAFQDAGIEIAFNPERTVIDDSGANGFDHSWTAAELHNAMKDHFSKIRGKWPNWQLWGLLAQTFDTQTPNIPSESVLGIMFDRSDELVGGIRGAGKLPHRQGFAVFQNGVKFDDLPTVTAGEFNAPVNDAEAEALRYYLFTWVHEAGHAFNFRHPVDRPGGDRFLLSWTNSPHDYDQVEFTGAFFQRFKFQYAEEELKHLRHGDLLAVIMGGDPFGSAASVLATATYDLHGAHAEGKGGQLELLLRSKEYFDFIEPVFVELRLRNRTSKPVEVDTRLDPAYGVVTLFVRHPNGQVLRYEPGACTLGSPNHRELGPRAKRKAEEGPDRYSEEIFLGSGMGGFYFDEPGEYRVWAWYRAAGGRTLPSNVHRVRVGFPFERAEDRLAQDYFSYPVGLSLYLRDHRAFQAKQAENILRDALHVGGDAPGRTARIAAFLAQAASEPFYEVKKREVKVKKAANAKTALALGQQAQERYLEVTDRQEKKRLNLALRKVGCQRVKTIARNDGPEEATAELQRLLAQLSEREVPANVRAEIGQHMREQIATEQN